MRRFPIFSLISVVFSFVLALLTVLGGSSPGFLPHAEMFTVNASRIGHTEVFSTSNSGGLLSSLENAIGGGLNNLLGDAGTDIAKAVGIQDFYLAHLLNFCSGSFEPSSTAANPSENITFCSKPQAFFTFNLTDVINKSLVNSATLLDLNWPNQITQETGTLNTTARIMFAFYLIGLIFAGIGVLTSFVAIFKEGRPMSITNLVVLGMSTLGLGIGTILSTLIIGALVRVFNNNASVIGLAAKTGSGFLALTWFSLILMGFSASGWFISLYGQPIRRFLRRRLVDEKELAPSGWAPSGYTREKTGKTEKTFGLVELA